MQTTKTTEKTFHRGVLKQLLTSDVDQGGLGWAEGMANQVERGDGMLLPGSLMTFLRFGNAANTDAWAGLVKAAGSEEKAQQAAREAVRQALEEADSSVQVLREGVRVMSSTFSLWNPPFRRGASHSDRDAFSKNEFVTVPELTIRSTLGSPLSKRVDQGFYINGILLALTEVKTKQTSQSASTEGVAKLAGDFRALAFEALWATRLEFIRQNPTKDGKEPRWPGIDAGRKTLDPKWRRQVYNALPAYTKVAWLSAMDSTQVLLAPDPGVWIDACDRALTKALKDQPMSSLAQPPFPDMDKDLNQFMSSQFQRLPDPQGKADPWERVVEHLRGLLSGDGVARELQFWHHRVREKSKADRVMRGHLLRPRAPQRVALQQAMAQVHDYYAHEHDPTWMEQDLRQRLQASLPSLSARQMDEVVEGRLKYRNGRDAYSILIQGAAGLGKTNIAVWTASELHGLLEPLPPGVHPNTVRRPLFDRIVILTDRVELRDNIAQEAQRSGGTRGTVLGVDDQETLVAALTGTPLPRGKKPADILVVNLQKFPPLRVALEKASTKVKHTVGRTAFLIDEVHRSQNGDLNEAALNTFIDDLVQVASGPDGGQSMRKNLILGLTATPSEPILARFGLWRPGVGVADQARWVPHFSYAMAQAVEDGYVLNPMDRYVRLAFPLQSLASPTLLGAKNADRLNWSSIEVYENDDRQRLVANKLAKIFASTTMMAMPHGHHTVRVGRGKAMITVPSIRAAIGMTRHLREALIEIADNAKGTQWESYADVVRDVAENRVFVLFSSLGSGQGKNLGDCGIHNPPGFSTERQILDGFRCKGAGSNNEARNSIIVVVDKLLTGFDEPTLHTLHVDRSLKGIPLFQALCRPNRITDGKDSCLIIDTCRDESMLREAKRVFAAYGEMAATDLDGLELLERLEARRMRLLNRDNLRDLMKGGRGQSERECNERALARQAWVGTLQQDLLKAAETRRQIGGYLTEQRLAKPLMVLPDADTDPYWIDLLSEIHALLRAEADDSKRVAPVLFEVRDGGMDEVDLERPSHSKSTHDPESQSTVEGMVLSLVEQLENMQLEEDERLARTLEIRQFFDEVFERINQQSLRENNDAFRRSLSDSRNPLPYGEALAGFIRLFDAVTAGRGWLAKNDPRRKYVEAVRKRLDILLIDYRLIALHS